MNISQKKIAVLDLTHGGIPISIKLAKLGAKVTALDVYGTSPPSLLAELESLHGIKTLQLQAGKNTKKNPALLASAFDLLIAPVHLDPAYPLLVNARKEKIPVFSHHRIVGEILAKDPRLSKIKRIEITGSKAKTSTASLLADLLSRKSETVLHSSRGLEVWNKGRATLLHKGLSITPGSILLALDLAFKAGIQPNYFIFEISLGGTGSAELGLLTTLVPDYGIAKESKLASEAKLQLVRSAKPGSILVLNAGAKKALNWVAANRKTEPGKELSVLTFSDPFLPESEKTADLKLQLEANKIQLQKGAWTLNAKLKPGYNSPAYGTAFSAAAAAALKLGIKKETIKRSFEEFEGLSGRMQEKELKLKADRGERQIENERKSERKKEISIPLLDNSNSGMDIRSVEKALEYALLKRKAEQREKLFIIIGEEASQVCEGLPPKTVRAFLAEHEAKFEKILLVGKRMQPIKTKKTLYVASLSEGLLKVSQLAGEKDLVISCVKCFR